MTNLLRHRHLSVRAKVSLLTATVLVAVMALFGLLLYVKIGTVLIDTTARTVRASAAGAINERLNGPRPGGPSRDQPFFVPPAAQNQPGNAGGPPAAEMNRLLTDLARQLTTRDTAARTTDRAGATVADGATLIGVTSVIAPALDPATYQAVIAANQERHFRASTDDGPVLVELVPLVQQTPNGPQTIGVLELGTSLRSVDDFLGWLRLMLVIGTLLAVAVTVLLLALVIAGVLAPLRRMAGTSRAIAAGDLSRRVPVPRGDDELTDLARAFNEMVGKLEIAFATQRRFVADASHELRSPLAALGGGIEVLLLGADQDDPAKRTRLMRLMESEIARMSRLVDDLLTLTRFDANPLGTLQRAPVDLTALAAAVVDVTRLLAPDRDVRLDAPADTTITVQGDADRLRQALLNLCANARAYTPAGGTITVGVRQQHDTAVLTVTDTGQGIAAEDVPRVWDRFYRADPARARQAGQGGLGLGLAIVQAIVAAHGGTAAIQSIPGAGTTVTLTLPAATVQRKSLPQPAVALPAAVGEE